MSDIVNVRGAPYSARDENRDATVVALYKGGATMQEIADVSGGISRERVRQLLQRNGITGEYKALADRLGRVPAIHELHPDNGVSFWTVFLRYFDSIAELRAAAGLSPKDQRKGRPKQVYCGRGHDMAVTRASWGACRECARIRHAARRSGRAS